MLAGLSRGTKRREIMGNYGAESMGSEGSGWLNLREAEGMSGSGRGGDLNDLMNVLIGYKTLFFVGT